MDAIATANSIISMVELFDPSARTFLEPLRKAVPYIPAAAPIVIAAIKEGGSAIAAAEAAAPQLAQAIRNAAALMPHKTVDGGAAKQVENVTRTMFGFAHMTPDEERRWMDGTTPNVGNSQAGSG